MTIELHDVSKAVLAGTTRRPLFRHFDFWMEKGERVAVLGVKGTGKTTLLELICGATPVDGGWIERTSNVSWPIPNTAFLISASSVATNLRFLARLYGISQDKFVNEVAALAEIENFVNMKLSDTPRFVKVQLSFAIAMWFDFDIYIFDERIVPIGASFQKRAKQILESRIKDKGLLVATSLAPVALEYCDSAFVIDGGRAEHYTDLKAALRHFKTLSKDMVLSGPDEEVQEDEDDDDTPIF